MQMPASIECEHSLQLVCVKGAGLRAHRIAGKGPQKLGLQEEPAARNAGLAYAKHCQHRTTGSDVVLHEGLECLTDAMNRLRWLKSEAVSELFVRRGGPGLGLICQCLPETFLQHATPIRLLARELS